MFKPIPPLEEQPSANGKEDGEEGIMLHGANAYDAIFRPNSAGSKEFALINAKDYWHKVTVLNAANCDKEAVLKEIMEYVFPSDIIPVMCRDDGVHMYFLVRRCPHAIKKLCRVRLNINPKINMQIVLGFAHVKDIPLNMQECLTKVIKKRYNLARKDLDLSNFHRDPDLVDIFYCPLSQSRILHSVLNNEITIQSHIKTLNLSHNDICFVKNLGTPVHLRNINKVDLRHNLIASTAELVHLRNCLLQEILLDQNPLCEIYKNEHDYIKDVRNALPSLIKLDGFALPPPGFPRFIKNFISSEDNIPLADQFIRHYFTLYDSKNRGQLKGLYHKEALFSLSATFLPAQSTSNTARLTEYTMESRNLHKLSDYSKNLRLLHRGPDAIMGTLCKLPRTEHDPYSFTVDVVHCISGIMVSVKGVFKEPAVYKDSLIRSFYRVFILIQVDTRAFVIANEMVHVNNATTREAEKAFKITKPAVTPKMLSSKTENLTEAEKHQIVDTMSRLTTMNKKWCRKCMDETNWNVKEALIVFTELYKMNRIPEEAFFKN